MALTRKPRIGETLVYHNPHGKDQPVDVVVQRFLDRSPSIMVARFPPCPGQEGDQEIIWEFHDGLNAYLSHKQTDQEESA